jgi:hypothetical protein
MTMASNLFAPTSFQQGQKKGPSIKSVLISSISVPVLPDTIAPEVRMKFLTAMTAVASSKTVSLQEWKVYIAAYTLMLFPAMGKDLPRDSVRPTPISTEQITSFVNMYDSIKADPSYAEDTPPVAAETFFTSAPIMPGLPLMDSSVQMRHIQWEEHYKVVACHYAIVLFLAGKRIEGDDHSPITQKRPDALMRKAHLDGEYAVLNGPYRISDVGHVLINSAWAELTSLRIYCIKAFATFEAEGTDEVQDLIYTTMHLLKYSNMNHAKIANNFIAAYPWVHEVPALKSSLVIFVDSVKAADQYDSAVRPYVKLMFGDKANIFPRKEMEPLIACAVAATQDVNPTLAQFYTSDDYAGIVDAFLEERDRRSHIRDLKVKMEEAELLQWDDSQDTPEETQNVAS